MLETTFRNLTEQEETVIRALLSLNFPGSHELRAQLPGMKARQIDENGSLELKISGPHAINLNNGPVAEASYAEDIPTTINPIRVHVLLHARDGKLRMLEVYKDDSSRLMAPLNPKRFTLFNRFSKTSPEEGNGP